MKSDPTLADWNGWEVHSTSVPRLSQGTRLDEFPQLPKTSVCHLGVEVEQKKAKQNKIRTHRILLGRPGPVPEHLLASWNVSTSARTLNQEFYGMGDFF